MKTVVPSRLVLGTISILPIINTELLRKKKTMEALKIAQAEMNAIVAENPILKALTREIQPAADRTYKLGQEVPVHLEQKEDWLGTFTGVKSTELMITPCTSNANMRITFNALQVKLCYHPYEENSSFITSKSKFDHSSLC